MVCQVEAGVIHIARVCVLCVCCVFAWERQRKHEREGGGRGDDMGWLQLVGSLKK